MRRASSRRSSRLSGARWAAPPPLGLFTRRPAGPLGLGLDVLGRLDITWRSPGPSSLSICARHPVDLTDGKAGPVRWAPCLLISGPPMARLILATAEGQQAIELRPINSLGRHPNNTIQLLDKIVSKEHCILEQREGQFILRDLGSLNGTYVNGERVRGETSLKHGDEIALGSTRARYDDGSGVAPPLPPVSPGAIQNPVPAASWPQQVSHL